MRQFDEVIIGGNKMRYTCHPVDEIDYHAETLPKHHHVGLYQKYDHNGLCQEYVHIGSRHVSRIVMVPWFLMIGLSTMMIEMTIPGRMGG